MKNYLVELSGDVNMVFKWPYDIIHLKLLDSLSTMLDLQCVKGLEQHDPHTFMFDI